MQKFLLFLIVVSLVSCKSKDGDYTFFSASDDVKMGAAMHQQIANDAKFNILDTAKYKTAYQTLYSIRDAILNSGKILHKDEFEWNLYIVKDDSVNNAFCTPGGYIYVYTGLIKFLQTEEELAGVIGHEMAHADMRHSTDQMTKAYGLKVLIALIAGEDYSQYLEAGESLLQLSFSRSDEKEADLKSVSYLCETDYKASAFAQFFKRIQETEQDARMLQFLSTHPNPENRVENIIAEWKKLCNNEGKDFTASYKQLKESLAL